MSLRPLSALCSLLISATLFAEEPAPEPAPEATPAPAPDPAPQAQGATLVLSPRAEREARSAVDVFTRGLARAAERFGGAAPLLDADLAAATPGDLVSRCPARISTSCMAEAARRTGAQRTLSGSAKETGDGYALQLKVIDADTAETFAVRNVRLFPARGDEVDMAVAGECLGLDALWSSVGREGALEDSICGDRVFVTSLPDREAYAEEIGGDADDLWVTVLPDTKTRQAYREENGVLAGAFASATAVAVVGAATAMLLGVQTWLTLDEAATLADDNPQAFRVSDGAVTVMDELDPSVDRYRDLESRGRLETLAGRGAGLVAIGATVGAVAFYQLADIPDRYQAYDKHAE